MLNLSTLLLLVLSFVPPLFSNTIPLDDLAPAKGKLEHGKKVVCYVSTWARYRPERGQFMIDNIDPSLCTHLVYAFAGLNASNWTIKSLDPYNDLEENYGLGSYKKMTSLKSKFPHLKVTIAIGGWTEGSTNYSALAADPAARKVFTKSVSEFIKQHDFDGLDLDWEFPGKRGGKPEDKENFISLIKDLRTELTQGRYILTAALGAGLDTITGGYNLPEIYNLLDYLHLMCYDYHGLWETKTGANAPLSSLQKDDTLTVEWSVKYLLDNGVKPDKLILGVPLYGRTFLLEADESSGTLGEPSMENLAFKGPFTRTDGYLGYNEICTEIKNGNWSEHWDNATSTPFISSGNKVATFDDATSLTDKVKFAMELNLGGVMVWSMDTDDFRGDCGSKYPLINAINDGITEALRSLPTTTEKPIEPNSASLVSPTLFISFLSALFVIFHLV